MFQRLKQRWHVRDNGQFITIFLVFAITGSSAAKITGPILKGFTLFSEMNPWVFNTVYVVATLIFYQFLLITFGWLFGEYPFFLQFLKRMFRWK